jgi:ATP synthase protein I
MAGNAPEDRQHELVPQDVSSSRRRTLVHDDSDWDVERGDNNIVPLTRVEAERMFGTAASRPSRVTPFRVVIAQVALSLVATLMWLLFASKPGASALSAFLGGAICWIPGALFAARLKWAHGGASVGAWMMGEALKLGVTILMFVVVAFFYHDVRWIALLVTYLIALKSYWIAMAWR